MALDSLPTEREFIRELITETSIHMVYQGSGQEGYLWIFMWHVRHIILMFTAMDTVQITSKKHRVPKIETDLYRSSGLLLIASRLSPRGPDSASFVEMNPFTAERHTKVVDLSELSQ